MSSDSEIPKPTQLARTPVTDEDLRSNVILCLTCFGLAAIGAAVWFIGPLVITDTWQTQSQAITIALASPLMLLASFYFLYAWVRDWRFRNTFNRNKQRTNGTITHLWRGKDNEQKTAYFVGYGYHGQSVYQAVDKQAFSSLIIGKEISVDYLPDEPIVSVIELEGSRSKRKKDST